MSATQRIIDRLTADNVRILQTPRPEDPAQWREFTEQTTGAMAENNRKIGLLKKQLGR